MVEGNFDFTPAEEVEPIELTERLVTLFGQDIDPPADPDIVAIRLLRAKMFGTGGHPSSKIAVLKMLSIRNRIDRQIPGPFLEIGATTGLLALVAAFSGTKETFHGSESIDAAALAEDNGVLNGHVIESEPTHLSLCPESRVGKYLTIATQVGGTSAALHFIPFMYIALKTGGRLIWAGHKASEHQAIKAKLEEFFDTIEVDDFLGWPVLVMTKSNVPFGQWAKVQ